MKLYIKYMVSIRCKMVVKSELDKLGLHYGTVDLGEVEIKDHLTDEKRVLLRSASLRFAPSRFAPFKMAFLKFTF